MKPLRILSLLPAATEIVYLLGLEKYLVGVSHECDYPPQVKKKPRVTTCPVDNSMSSKAIDEGMKKAAHSGPGIFHIEERMLGKLEPNLILTQELCEVCAVGFNEVKQAVGNKVKIISLEPESVEDILESILLVGEAIGARQQAGKIVEKLKKRLKIYDLRFKNLKKRPKVLVIEWLEPLMVVGHWIPEMIGLAGGVNLISKPGQQSKIITVDQIVTSKPDILIISPCGFDIKRTIKERKRINKIINKLGAVKAYLVDGNAYMTRPGPRIIDGIEILAEILHPEIFPKKHSKTGWVEFMV